MADLFTLIGIVPVEQRKALGGEVKYTAAAKTMGR
jgi:hypothetical protein